VSRQPKHKPSLTTRLAGLTKIKFVRDTLVLQLGSVVQSGTYFVTSVLTARSLGDEQLGRWATARELYMFIFFMVSMGLTNAAVSSYSKARGQDDREAATLALAALLKLGLIVSLLAAVFGVLLAPRLAEALYDGDREVGVITAILCFGCLGEVLRSLTLAVLSGARQMKRYVAFDALTNLLRLGLVGGALLIERTPEAVAVALLSHALLSGALGLVAYQRAGRLHETTAPPPFREVLTQVPRAPLRQMLGTSSLLAAGKAMNNIVPRLPLILIPALAVSTSEGFADNGAFQVAMVLNMVLAGVVGAIGTNLLPTLGFKMGQADVPMEQLGATLRKVSLAAGAFTAGATLVSLPAAYVVLKVFYGEEFDGAFPLFWRLASGNLVLGFCVIVEPWAIYAHQLRKHVARNVVLALLIASCVYWATANFGAQGAALAAGLARAAALVHMLFIWLWFRRRRPLSGDTHPA